MPQSKVEVKLNRAGVGQLLKCAEMQSLLREQAARIGDEVEVYVAQTRAVAEAKGDNSNNSMLKRLSK